MLLYFKQIVKKCNPNVKSHSLKLYKKQRNPKCHKLIFLLIIFFGVLVSYSQNSDVGYHDEKVKIALREIGNELLLIHGDSVSRVMPIKKVDDLEFIISFQKDLYIEPEALINTTKASFNKLNILTHNITEVIDCTTSEVVYSYHNNAFEKNNSVACIGRILPVGCYEIRVILIKNMPATFANNTYLISSIIILFLLASGFLLSKYKAQELSGSAISNQGIRIGNSIFYFDQQIVRQGNNKITLTSKESEILKIFSQNPNQIIKREQLTKTVWEDHGVIVGRSLDMFISKLRKKLSNDSSVKIVNIHGVGYKIEI